MIDLVFAGVPLIASPRRDDFKWFSHSIYFLMTKTWLYWIRKCLLVMKAMILGRFLGNVCLWWKLWSISHRTKLIFQYSLHICLIISISLIFLMSINKFYLVFLSPCGLILFLLQRYTHTLTSVSKIIGQTISTWHCFLNVDNDWTQRS
jgi:hypothetical protein